MTETMEREFPQLKFEHQLIDSAALIMMKSPTKLNGIIVTSNLFGDIISDQASGIPGTLGLSPSASLIGIPDGKSLVNGIYEPIHGILMIDSSGERGFKLIRYHRICTRHFGTRMRQSDSNDLVHGYDAAVLAVPA